MPPGPVAPAFFILSSGRSGSTLLASMLNMHPRIHVPVELFGLYSRLPSLLPWYGDLARERNRRLLALDLGRIGQLAEFGVAPDPDAFAARVAATRGDFAAVARCFYETLLHASGKAVLGDKTPNHVPQLPLIEKTFPDARVVHLLRDGRACAASSMRSRGGINQRNSYELGLLWPRNNAAIARFGQRHPARYHRLRYEELVADPPSALRKLCDFLGEDYQPAMLDFAAGEFARENARRLDHHANVTRGIIPGDESRWRSALTPVDLAVYEALAGEGLREFGYPAPVRGPPPGAIAAIPAYWAATQYRRLRRALRDGRVGALHRLALTAKRVVSLRSR